ncbi:MAG: phytanoyl-CoA dioxygenase family protein [Chloroherpetonaceae bacterium]|nr:phytanoyl-CoA dioxygenase family protein [Chthonomonadaceae bacterium]MDW8208427.1 phytanoyl-CoA dioxygenase family protein [Chloroherpetonaceae bacterium]
MRPLISPEQHQQYEERGFFVLEDLFTATDLEPLLAVLEKHHALHEARLQQTGTEGISRAGEIAFTAHIARNDPTVLAFCRRPEFIAITTQLLGPDVDLYWDQTVFKGPEGQHQFPWHQDDGYTPVTPSPYLTLWLALNDATVENGCVWVLPGSHRLGLLPHKPGPTGLTCYPLDAPDQGVPVPVRAGSVVVFQSLTVHKSGTNRSSGMRKAYIIQYAQAGLRSALTGELIPGTIPIARGGNAVA